MSKQSEAVKSENESLSVDEIDTRLSARLDDLDLRVNLAYALVDRYLFGEADHPAGDETDINRVEGLVAKLPKDRALFPRAYLAYHENKDQDFIRWSVKWASEVAQNVALPYNCDELVNDFIEPFEEIPTELWGQWAEALSRAWNNSAAVFTLQGFAKLDHDGKPEEAIDNFVLALDRDPGYWLAAWACAQIYDSQKNWQGAFGYYLKALKVESAQGMPTIHFDAAWCLGKLKKYQKEEKHYRRCLELDPDFPNARNNLGWSLLKQNKNGEALKVLEESIRRGNDGKYPQQNKARVLTKLGRYTESIEAWQQCTHRGKPPKSITSEISRLQEIVEKQRQGQIVVAEEVRDESNDEDEGSISEANEKPSSVGVLKTRLIQTPTRTEQMLEEMIEHLIKSGSDVFGKRLRMYNPPDGSYGRQYPIPAFGRIDLLVEDLDTGNLIVIELKRDESHEQVIGQISLYMSWVRENLAAKEAKVSGIICVNIASNKLLLAARNIEGVEVYEYGLSFRKV